MRDFLSGCGYALPGTAQKSEAFTQAFLFPEAAPPVPVPVRQACTSYPRLIFKGILLIVHPAAILRSGFVHSGFGQRWGCVPLGLQLQVFKQQTCGDASGLENHGQAAARMCTASDQVDLVKILKAVVRPKVKHLPQVMRHAESRSFMQRIICAPVSRRDHFLEADPAFHVLNADLLQLAQSQRSKAPLVRRPNQRFDARA